VDYQVKYKEAYEANKGKGATPVPETPEMALAKQLHPVQSNKLYSEKSKKMLKDVNVPPGELFLWVCLKSNLYASYCDNILIWCKNWNMACSSIEIFPTDGQDITHAISSQQLASPHPYTKEYKESIRGQGPTDPAVAYPEHELHKKAMNLASSVSFCADCFGAMLETSFQLFPSILALLLIQ